MVLAVEASRDARTFVFIAAWTAFMFLWAWRWWTAGPKVTEPITNPIMKSLVRWTLGVLAVGAGCLGLAILVTLALRNE